MAKSSRASTVKANNQRLKAKVYGPVEQARRERLSARLLEVAAAPKPPQPEESEMKIVEADEEAEVTEKATTGPDTMEVDSTSISKRATKNRIAKRKNPSKIVFKKYSDRKNTKKR